MTDNKHAWSLAFWVKFNNFSGNTQIVDMRYPGYGWPANNWGTSLVLHMIQVQVYWM